MPSLPPLLLAWLHLPPLPHPMTGSFAPGSTRNSATVVLRSCTSPNHTLSFSGSFDSEMKVEGRAVWLRAHAENKRDVSRHRRLHVVYSANVVHGASKLFTRDGCGHLSLRCSVLFDSGIPHGALLTFGAKGHRAHLSYFMRGTGFWLEFDGDPSPSPRPPSPASDIQHIVSDLLDCLDPPPLPSLRRATEFSQEEGGACVRVEEKRYWRGASNAAGLHVDDSGSNVASALVLKSSRSFTNGMLDGVERLYTRTGSLFTSRSYLSGALHGALQQFRDDASLLYVALCLLRISFRLFNVFHSFVSYSEMWRAGKRHGPRVCWSDDGQSQLMVQEFTNGSGVFADFRGGRLQRTASLVDGRMHGDEIWFAASPPSAAAACRVTGDGNSDCGVPAHIAAIFRYVDGRLEGLCETFDAGVCVQSSQWHGGLLHGESVVYSEGAVIQRTEYSNGCPIVADNEGEKTEDDSARAAAALDLRLAELQMAAWEAECHARAAAAAALAATADVRRFAGAVVAEALAAAVFQSGVAASAAAERKTAAAVEEAACSCNVSDSAAATAASLVELMVDAATAEAEAAATAAAEAAKETGV